MVPRTEPIRPFPYVRPSLNRWDIALLSIAALALGLSMWIWFRDVRGRRIAANSVGAYHSARRLACSPHQLRHRIR